MKREHVPFLVSRLIGNRPVRWAPAKCIVGDYDGRNHTLEVFNADPKDQRGLLGDINKSKLEIELAAGGPFVTIFHSVKQSSERYADFIALFPKPLDGGILLPAIENCVDQEVQEGQASPHWRAA